jgi:hypothetical protein
MGACLRLTSIWPNYCAFKDVIFGSNPAAFFRKRACIAEHAEQPIRSSKNRQCETGRSTPRLFRLRFLDDSLSGSGEIAPLSSGETVDAVA